jgi:hypothetical protein
LYPQINVFMTHMSNYGNDRLALYTFESVIKYIQCWTNLQMVTLPPVSLAERYFKMHPDELDPIWGVRFIQFCKLCYSTLQYKYMESSRYHYLLVRMGISIDFMLRF